MNRRGDTSTQGVVIAVVLGIIVLASVLMFVSQPKILNWLQNLPGYNNPVDTSEVLSDEQMKILNYEVVGHVNIKTKRAEFGGTERYIDFVEFIEGKSVTIPTPIYLDNEKSENNLMYGDIAVGLDGKFDFKIGILEADRVKITIKETEYKEYVLKNPGKAIPDFSLVQKKLDSAKFIDFYLYKTKSEIIEEPIKPGAGNSLILN